MRTIFLTAFYIFLTGSLYCQVRFFAGCRKIKDNTYSIGVNGMIDKGWRVFVSRDTSLNLEPFSVNWNESAITRSGAASISNKKSVKDALFENKLLAIVDDNFIYQQPVIINVNAPAAILLKIKGFAADKENFVPIDTTIACEVEGGNSSTTLHDQELKLSNLELDKPLNSCGDQQEISAGDKTENNGWIIFLKGFSGGLLALLMPCIFPMIPVTISVFTGKSNGLRNSFIYGLSIIMIYTLASLPFHLVSKLDPQVLNSISTDASLNLFFFIIFVLFSLSLFGLFEIRLPAAFGNKAGNKSSAASLPGIFFMALTLCIISFSCTGPILGFLLANTIGNGAWPLTIGLFGFGLALALPFTLFALFPQWLKKIPGSGDWMDTIKKAFAFIELAFALKFLSNADLVRHWGLLKRETFIVIWMLIAFAMALFILIKAKGSYVIGLVSLLLLVFCVYLGIGLFEQRDLSLLSGFPPPRSYSIFENTAADNGRNVAIVNDYALAVKQSRQQHKPMLLGFTGWACVNCRRMEENVWTKIKIKNLLAEKFILVSLYVDDRKPLDHPFLYDAREIATVGDKWATFQSLNFKQSTQPLYAILNENGQLLNNPVGYTPDDLMYEKWLQCGLAASKPNH